MIVLEGGRNRITIDALRGDLQLFPANLVRGKFWTRPFAGGFRRLPDLVLVVLLAPCCPTYCGSRRLLREYNSEGFLLDN